MKPSAGLVSRSSSFIVSVGDRRFIADEEGKRDVVEFTPSS
jgi:hypothetical protein